MGNAFGSMKYADEFVLLAKEETVLQGESDRWIEIGRCCGTKMNVEGTEVIGISRQPFHDAVRLVKHDWRWRNNGEISPTRCNNCVFIRSGFTLHVSGDNLTHNQEYNAVYGHR